MKKLIGIFLFLMVLYGALLYADPNAGSVENHLNLAERIGLFGIISIGAGILIISGGIDLSIASVAVLSATCLTMLLESGYPVPLAIIIVILLGCFIGLIHGLIVTLLRVQAFVVTLCGLFAYRGIARWLAEDKPRNLTDSLVNLKYDFYDNFETLAPLSFMIFLGILSIFAIIFLHFSVYGRYLRAIGNNEKAALYSGVRTRRYKILAYIICSGLASVFGVLYMFKYDQIQPSSAMPFYELYAIAAAVLGGCSLRGGEGMIVGMLIGTCILRLLDNLVIMYQIPNQLTATVIGGALLLGVILDEVLRRNRGESGV